MYIFNKQYEKNNIIIGVDLYVILNNETSEQLFRKLSKYC